MSLVEPSVTTSTRIPGDRPLAAVSRWWPVIVVAVLIALTLSTPVGSRAADESAARELTRAHDRLALLMSARGASAVEMEAGLEQLEPSVAPLVRALRRDHPELAGAIESELRQARAQLHDGNRSLSADRSEFDVAYLVPLAQSLSDARDALGDASGDTLP